MLWCVLIRAAASRYYNCFDHDSSFHNCDSPGNREFILVIGHLLGGFLKAEFVAVMRNRFTPGDFTTVERIDRLLENELS